MLQIDAEMQIFSGAHATESVRSIHITVWIVMITLNGVHATVYARQLYITFTWVS
jgi:hypothetical protein